MRGREGKIEPERDRYKDITGIVEADIKRKILNKLEIIKKIDIELRY